MIRSDKHNDMFDAILSLLFLSMAAALAFWGEWIGFAQEMELLGLICGIVSLLVIPRPRYPDAVTFQANNWRQAILKWISAPQIETLILLWLGMALIAQPSVSHAFSLSGSHALTQGLGIMFVLLAWQMAIQLPTPLAYTLMTVCRLLYLVLIVIDMLSTGSSLLSIGIYLGGILHGILAMLVQWELRQMASEIHHLRHRKEN